LFKRNFDRIVKNKRDGLKLQRRARGHTLVMDSINNVQSNQCAGIISENSTFADEELHFF